MRFGICTPSAQAAAARAAGWDYVEDNVQGLLQGLVPAGDDQWSVPDRRGPRPCRSSSARPWTRPTYGTSCSRADA